MKIATTDNVTCEIDSKGSIIVKSKFAKQLADAQLQIKVNIMNPFKEFKCVAGSKNVFQINLKNPSANTVLASTNPLLDISNCIDITKQKLYIYQTGTNNVAPGLVYTYSVSLERPGDGIKITPTVTGF